LAVAEKLRIDWSPEQLAGWLKRQFPDRKSMHVSHETIYRSFFIQAKERPRKTFGFMTPAEVLRQ